MDKGSYIFHNKFLRKEDEPRELFHKLIKVRVFETEHIFQDAWFFLDEVEHDLWEAETKIPLMLTPYDIVTDLQVAMADAGIKGKVVDVDYSQFGTNLNIAI